MALPSASTKNLLDEYHRLAADTLQGHRHSHLDQAILSAAENGQLDRIRSLLNDPNAAIDARCSVTGDTPLIAAARNGHERVVEFLVAQGADLTLQNDMEENSLEVASDKIRNRILKSIRHEGREMSNAQALLQSAWFGDSVSVKQRLTGKHYLDVNCSNGEGMTPLLLVTKDLKLFESIQMKMETADYDPIGVIQTLIDNHVDINHCDSKGRSALHFAATADSVQARRMVSILMRNGSTVDTLDNNLKSPLHVASGEGLTSIVIALVEEGGADVNSKGGERNDTPLMFTARAGHSEAARYLIAKGADVTAVDDNGDSALSVAATTSMVSLLKEAWTEQTQCKDTTPAEHCPVLDQPPLTGSQLYREPPSDQSHIDSTLPNTPSPDYSRESDSTTSSSLAKGSFFLTDQCLSQSLNGLDQPDCGGTTLSPETLEDSRTNEVEPSDDEPEIVHVDMRLHTPKLSSHDQLPAEVVESGDKQLLAENYGKPELPLDTHPAHKPLGHENHGSAIHKVGVSEPRSKHRTGREEKKTHKEKKTKAHPRKLQLQMSNDPSRSRSHDSLVGVASNEGTSRRILPNVRSGRNAQPTKQSRLMPSTQNQNKLPMLTNMHAIAMVTVDTDQDKLRVHKFKDDAHQVQSSNAKQTVHRSKSLFAINSTNISLDFKGKKRRSLGSLSTLKKSDPTPSSKHTLLPNVITPQLGAITGGRALKHTQQQQKGRGQLQPLNLKSAVKSKLLNSHLSIVTEATESFDRTLSQTRSVQDLHSSSGSKDSTLKASSHSAFEPDSLETGVAKETTKQPSGNPLPYFEAAVDPPTPAGCALPQSNLVINHAVQNLTTPLSPIWNKMQYLCTDSETSSNTDYITSYIGRSTPLPRLQTPDLTSKRVGGDSGQGESGDDCIPGDSESSEDSDPLEDAAEEAAKESLRWKRGRILGKGAYGKVWEGLMDSAKLIAVKEVEVDYTSVEKARSQYEKIQMEVEILRSLRHKNIVSYLGTSMQEGVVFIFMDYISGGSVQSVLKRFGPLDARTIAHYSKQITRALLYLHSNGIIHRDIKGGNIMVTIKGIVKLIDFGSAKRYCQDATGGAGLYSVRGTPYWMAPEVICGQGYGRKSDIWSLGCTIHEMALTKPPWADHPPEAAMFQIGMGKSIPDLPDTLPDLLTQLIHRCMTRDQMDRPGALELLEDPFVISYTAQRNTRPGR